LFYRSAVKNQNALQPDQLLKYIHTKPLTLPAPKAEEGSEHWGCMIPGLNKVIEHSGKENWDRKKRGNREKALKKRER